MNFRKRIVLNGGMARRGAFSGRCGVVAGLHTRQNRAVPLQLSGQDVARFCSHGKGEPETVCDAFSVCVCCVVLCNVLFCFCVFAVFDLVVDAVCSPQPHDTTADFEWSPDTSPWMRGVNYGGRPVASLGLLWNTMSFCLNECVPLPCRCGWCFAPACTHGVDCAYADGRWGCVPAECTPTRANNVPRCTRQTPTQVCCPASPCFRSPTVHAPPPHTHAPTYTHPHSHPTPLRAGRL